MWDVILSHLGHRAPCWFFMVCPGTVEDTVKCLLGASLGLILLSTPSLNLHESIKADEKFDAWRSPSKVKISDSSCLANFVSFAFEGLCSLANTMKFKNNINISFLWFSLKQRAYKRFPGRCMWRSTVTLNVCSHGEPRGGTQVY